MITYISKSNSARYNALFAEATKALKDAGIITDPSLEITTLEQYFSFMGSLPHLNKGEGKKYTILPLDEEVFEINANTRAITVPSNFKNYGISVQGDQIAEIVYFKIDRFFDATDLNEMDIYIQWEAANGDTGASKEWVRDIESEPGKIIFGWPLSNKITETAGTIKFAVRFYKIAQDETGADYISYSFSTLTATASIKPALDFSILGDIGAIDDSKIIANRFTNSKVVGGEKPVAPKYFIDLAPEDAESKEYDLDATSGTLDLIVHAYSTDAGSISYIWKKKNEEGELEDVLIYVLTEDKEAKEGKVYLEKQSEGIYIPYTGVITPEILDPTNIDKYIPLYEERSSCTVDSVGEYYAIATNRLQFVTAETYSKTAIIPYPVAPTVSDIKDVDGNKITNKIVPEGENIEVLMKVEASTIDTGSLSYEWSKDQIAIPDTNNASYTATEEGRYSVVVTNTRNKEAITATTKDLCRVTYPATLPIISGIIGLPDFGIGDEIDASNYVKADRADSFEYQWYMATSIAEDDETIKDANQSIYVPREAGSYYVKIRSIYNKNASEWVQSDLFRVIK